MRVKICGIARLADAQAASAAGADFIGLIRAPSPRAAPPELARAVIATLSDDVTPVLLFRDQPLTVVAEEIAASGARWVQLHGSESSAFVAELVQRFPALQIIRAWSVTDRASAGELAAELAALDAAGGRVAVVLLDAPKGGRHPGYAALASVAQQLAAQKLEIWCAGALTPQNLPDAVPPGVFDGVDVARGVEAAPGEKDPTAIREFIAAARRLAPREPRRED